ncbi:hypothetical protein F4779DRAFT_564058 [Xylariaceae sp. FL0662B]|nr:hypothetical protein F4779DRAFT_564058 [Xylariaceae sp. FL0662B]
MSPARVVQLRPNENRREWIFLCDGACWEIAMLRFGKSGSLEDLDLATGIARIQSSLSWDNLERTGNMTSNRPLTIPWVRSYHPRRYETHQDVLESRGVDLGKLQTALSRLMNKGTKRIESRSAATKTRKSTFKRRCSTRDDIFARLPVELLLYLLNFIRTKDLPQLRLASRDIAGVSTLDQLPKSFWRMRVYDEHPYLVPSVMDGTEDWRALHFTAPPLWRPSFGSTDNWGGSPQELGRATWEDIWKGLDGVGQFINRTAQGLPVDETNLDILRTEADVIFGPMKRVLQLVTPASAQLRHPRTGHITPRIHETRRLPWISKGYRLRRIGVTVGHLGKHSGILHSLHEPIPKATLAHSGCLHT